MDVTPGIMRLIGVDPDIGAETVPDTHQPTSVMGWGLSKFPQHRSGTAQNACFKHKRKKPHGRPVLGSAENMN